MIVLKCPPFVFSSVSYGVLYARFGETIVLAQKLIHGVPTKHDVPLIIILDDLPIPSLSGQLSFCDAVCTDAFGAI